VAAAAQAYGLASWTQATVASLELGRRSLSIGELALLPLILRAAGVLPGRPVAASELVPGDDEDVEVTPDCTLPVRIVRGLLEGGGSGPAMSVRRTSKAVIGEAERKAARKLQVTPGEVDQAARALWRESLTAHRDRLVGFRTRAMLQLDPAGGA